MKKLHIRRTDTIILYDPNPAGLFSVCRIALMFRYFGSQNVRILNGGLKKWISEGRPTFSGAYVPGGSLESDGDYNYCVVNENLFVKDISIVHNAAHEIFNGSTGI
jgi:3-mercaptopyruvate sulfurtransferase SseA